MNATIVVFYIVPAVITLLFIIIIAPLVPEMGRGIANAARRFAARVACFFAKAKQVAYIVGAVAVFFAVNAVYLHASNAFYNFLFGWF